MKGNLLIVDDEQAIREVISTYLGRYDYECDIADDAASAIDKIKHNDYDIIITDKRLPSNDDNEGGIAIINFVREFNPSIAIIVMTGYASIESAVTSMKLGAFDYITKPFEIDKLKQKVDRIREYQNFLNPDNIIDLYRLVHDQILDVIDTDCLDSKDKQHLFLQQFNKNIDFVFSTIKKWETIIFDQRERLTNIAFYTEQLKDSFDDNDPAYSIIENIWREAGQRL